MKYWLSVIGTFTQTTECYLKRINLESLKIEESKILVTCTEVRNYSAYVIVFIQSTNYYQCLTLEMIFELAFEKYFLDSMES